MSVTRDAGQTVFGDRRKAGSAPRRRRRRWAAKALAGMLITGAALAAYAISLVARRDTVTVPVTRGDLLVSLTGYGLIESRDNLDINCSVPGSTGILEIVPDGSLVRQGDVLVRIDTSPLQQAIAAQKLALAKAEGALGQAKKDLNAAKIAIDAYREGTLAQEQLKYDRDILLARKGLSTAEHSLLQTELSHRRGFGSQRHVEAQKFAVETARSKLATAEHNKQVLTEFTAPKVLAELAAKSDAAEARAKSYEVAVQHEQVRLDRLLDDLAECVIRAPRSGMAIYAGGPTDASDTSQPVPEVFPGARVRHRQTLLRIADLEQLQIKMLVSEKKIGRLRRGQQARVKVLGQERQGEVASIADRSQTTTVADLNFRQYAVGIALEKWDEHWKPGMTAEIDVLVAQKKNVLTVPVVCVVKQGGEPHLQMRTLRGTALREVTLGSTNDVFVEIVGGVSEGDLVLLNPVLADQVAPSEPISTHGGDPARQIPPPEIN